MGFTGSDDGFQANGDAWNADTGDSWKQDDGAKADGGFGFGGDNEQGAGEGTGGFGDDDDRKGGGLTGECYNCGQVGHNKADCTNDPVARAFTGTCNVCQENGHMARDCPTRAPMVCRNCKQEGHRAIDCKAARAINWEGIPDLTDEEAWTRLVDACKTKDLDSFRLCLKAYARSIGSEFSLPEIERSLREDKLPIYLIAKKQEVAKNQTIIDLVGNLDRQYVLTFQLSDKPKRKRMAAGWPASPEENMTRLTSAGFVQDRGIPLCSRCGDLGHIMKHCKQEAEPHESVQPVVQCIYCQEVGHRARDCPKPRVDPFTCKRCGKPGHKVADCTEEQDFSNVECRKCNQMGHMSRDCPNAVARACRNCGEEGHMAVECDKPRRVTCRNCEKDGHMARDCPEPKDWSKVKCSNCGEMGHTIKRCKKEIPEDNDGDKDGGFGLNDSGPGDAFAAVESTGGWGTAAVAASGGW